VILLDVLTATIFAATPLLLAALGGLCSERGGVVNIALEGIMLFGAFAAAAATLATGSPVLGILAGMSVGAAVAALHGLFSIYLRADQVISGIAVNLLAASGTVLLLKLLYGTKGSSPQLGELDLFGVPLTVFLTVLAFAAVPLVWFLLYRTRFGLRLRACGETPEAADATGIGVHRYRMAGVVLSGVLAGLAGVFLVMIAGSFAKNMSAGRGYIALAALVFGRWRPVPVAIGCLVFALGRGVQDVLELKMGIPPQLSEMMPYALTLLVLAAWPLIRRGKMAEPPAALGSHFVRD
jgi:simple sugar transport system permease protein